MHIQNIPIEIISIILNYLSEQDQCNARRASIIFDCNPLKLAIGIYTNRGLSYFINNNLMNKLSVLLSSDNYKLPITPVNIDQMTFEKMTIPMIKLLLEKKLIDLSIDIYNWKIHSIRKFDLFIFLRNYLLRKHKNLSYFMIDLPIYFDDSELNKFIDYWLTYNKILSNDLLYRLLKIDSTDITNEYIKFFPIKISDSILVNLINDANYNAMQLILKKYTYINFKKRDDLHYLALQNFYDKICSEKTGNENHRKIYYLMIGF